MSNNEITPEQFEEIRKKVEEDISKGGVREQCYIRQYKTDAELERERINRERRDWFERTDGLSMGAHPEDCNIF